MNNEYNEYKEYLDKLLKTLDNRISHLDKRQREEKWNNQEIRNVMEPVRNERQLVYRILIRDPELLEEEK
ncbi:hypothetical protein AN634_04265 [Lactiplantibacillus plantarum]|uniref:hypothetical protein n=1 Tax=Lactiplantibacillus plantarum TaxID=1590 RepID=UPI0006D49BD8|nr:hypothetical protein [Lactiplantibacillus plantarum]ALG25301.1 hypothetical protein AN634_04265 [Lactiplantibacillus plantarum]